jgi:hypothetical protein
MTEHPILFSGPMVRAILDGSKTQTRRVITPQPPALQKLPAGHYFDAYNGGPNWNFWTSDHKMDNGIAGPKDNSCQWTCPFGKKGDILWVRETFSVLDADEGPAVCYRATDHRDCGPWQPSIFMPRDFCRITLEITDIRAMRLAPISEEDFIAEGGRMEHPADPAVAKVAAYKGFSIGRGVWKTENFAFKDLWDTLNAKRGWGWETNPWVWTITFKRIE